MRFAVALFALTIVGFSQGRVAAEDRIPAPRLSRDKLLVYRDANGAEVAIGKPVDWLRRRQQIMAGVQAVMGRLPGEARLCPLAMKVEDETDLDTYVRRLVTYESEPGSRVPAYLCIPKAALNGAKTPAVLCLHGTDNVVGHGSVVGLGGKANRRYAAELAARGYVTLAPNYPKLAKYQPDLDALGWESGTLKAVWDNTRGLDLLDSLPFVKVGEYGVIGHSLGGHNAVFTAVHDPRIVALVSSCGLDSFCDYFKGDSTRWQTGKGWTQPLYMPKLGNYRDRLEEIPFDFHELIGALAPRHVLIIAPTRDHNFKADSVDRVAAAASEVYKLFGHAERLRVLHPDCDHDFPVEMREEGYKLFDEVLRNDVSR